MARSIPALCSIPGWGLAPAIRETPIISPIGLEAPLGDHVSDRERRERKGSVQPDRVVGAHC